MANFPTKSGQKYIGHSSERHIVDHFLDGSNKLSSITVYMGETRQIFVVNEKSGMTELKYCKLVK